MAAVFQLFRQPFTSSDTIVVPHNADSLAVAVRVLIDDNVDNQLVESIICDPIDPRNVITVKLTSVQTGTIQVVSTGIAASPTVDPTVPGASTEVQFAPEYNNDKGDYATHYVAAGGSSRFSFRIPSDFVSLVKLVMVAIPNNTTVNDDIDLSSDYGKVGEPYNAHSESNTTLLWSATASEIVEFDIVSVFSAIEAGDECGLFIDQNGITGGVHYLWILLEYVSAS